MTTAVSFHNVSIVFGDYPDKALPLMDAGQSRTEIQEETSQVLGRTNTPGELMPQRTWPLHPGEVGLSQSGVYVGAADTDV